MAAISTADLPQTQKEELLCTYATLILYDEGMDVTAENISKLIKASGASVEPFMPVLFARALGETNIGTLLNSAGSVSAAPAGAAAAPQLTESASTAVAPAKEEEKEEPEGKA